MNRPFAYLFFVLSIISSLSTQAQSVSRDPDPTHWINYGQTYVKIPTAENGLYRITAAELQQSGVPVRQLDPLTIQLFHRGVEQAIYVEGETDRRFDASDFIEFYGRANDGLPDSLLYRPHTAQPHAYYSLFSDTTAYFLTWRLDNKPGRRMTTDTDTAYAGLTTEAYHWKEELRLFTDDYPGWAAGIPPKIEYSHYEAGEGYTGKAQQKNKLYTTIFSLRDAVRDGPDPQVDVLLAGRDFTNHRVEGLIGPATNALRRLDTVSFSVYNNARIQKTALWSDVGSDGQLLLSTLSWSEASTTDAYSVSYIRLRYPQRLRADGQSTRLFQLAPNLRGRSLIDVTDVQADTRFWDISDPTAPIQLKTTTPAPGSARLVVHGTDTTRTLLAVSQPKSVPAIRTVTFTNRTSRKPTYLIITHETLMKPASGTTNAVRDYAAYRASVAGGGHDTLTVTMQQLIDQYSYGERHPLAIRRFARQMLQQNKDALQYLLLIGRSRSMPGIRRDPNQASLDLVMTAGFPGSDAVFTAGINDKEPNVPAIPTGRINAGTPQEVIDYLNKVKEYERLPAGALWRKNLLHLSGGETPSEVTLFRQLVDTYRHQAIGPSLGARVTTISKITDKLVESISVAKNVNEGVGLMTFFGHSGLDVTDLDIGFCSNDALGYRNKGNYPIMLINGCAIGNFFYGRPTLSTDWVLTPDRGAIAAIAHSHLGYPDVMHQYSTTLYSLLTDSTQADKSIGQLQQETIRRILAQTGDGRIVANCQQMVLQGDPAIKLLPLKTPDYALTSGGLTVQGTDQQPLSTGSDSVRIRAIVQNGGQYWGGPLPVRVRRFVNGRESGVFNFILPQTVAYLDTLTLTVANQQDADGQNQFEVTINPTDSPSVQKESNHANNQAITEVTLGVRKPILIYPPGLPEGQIRLTSPLSTDIRQGDVVGVPVEFTNLSPYPFSDSVVVKQTIYAAGLTNPQITQWRLPPLAGTDTVRFISQIATQNLPGLNQIVLTANPGLQPEYSFLNNTLDVALSVQPDAFGPLLEVAFDGARITDGAVVSAQPLLDVLVADENRSVIRHDTTGLALFLQRPGRNTPFERLSWNNATIQPTGADKAFRLRCALPKLTEGTHHLLITARDAIGNLAVPYQVSFRVVNDRALTELTVYPNPFRDQVYFAFTLTGDHAPATVILTLTDLNGRVVRHLTQRARIGLNRWAWDGRSDSGALLPAGVYVYKLTITNPNEWPVAASLNGRLNSRIVLIR